MQADPERCHYTRVANENPTLEQLQIWAGGNTEQNTIATGKGDFRNGWERGTVSSLERQHDWNGNGRERGTAMERERRLVPWNGER